MYVHVCVRWLRVGSEPWLLSAFSAQSPCKPAHGCLCVRLHLRLIGSQSPRFRQLLYKHGCGVITLSHAFKVQLIRADVICKATLKWFLFFFFAQKGKSGNSLRGGGPSVSFSAGLMRRLFYGSVNTSLASNELLRPIQNQINQIRAQIGVISRSVDTKGRKFVRYVWQIFPSAPQRGFPVMESNCDPLKSPRVWLSRSSVYLARQPWDVMNVYEWSLASS